MKNTKPLTLKREIALVSGVLLCNGISENKNSLYCFMEHRDYFSKVRISLGVHSKISQSNSSVAVDIFLLCLRL